MNFIPCGRRVVEVRSKVLNEHNGKALFSVVVKPKLLILSAGAVYTAHLLKQNKMHLSSHLGKHLTIHPAARVLGLFDERIDWLVLSRIEIMYPEMKQHLCLQ